MITWYRSWLVQQNEKTGHPAWWLLAALGLAIVLAWMAAALPWVSIFTGQSFPSIGKFVQPVDGGVAILAFDRWILGEPQGSYYFLTVLFGIALAKMGYLLLLIGSNFGSGHIYLMPRQGAPLGCWAKAR